MSQHQKSRFVTIQTDQPAPNGTTFPGRLLGYSLALSLLSVTAVVAQNGPNGQQGQNQDQNRGRGPNIVDVGGPLTPGFARPPLLVNITPGNTGYYTPGQVRLAYGFDQITADGSGQTIGIVDAYGNSSIQSDLDTFCSTYGLASTTVKVVGTTGRNSGWALETALDVEWAHVIAPKAKIILSVARTASIGNLLGAVNAAVNAGANVISMSWGASEFSGEQSYESYFQHPGVTYVASSGDSAELTGGVEVEWPAASPSVVGVGGTSLYTDASGKYYEVAWGGSGGGLSSYFLLPSWQTGWNTFSLNQRGVPDVSYNADPNTGVPVYDAVNGGWWIVGGTSVGAPQWAAAIALANQLDPSGAVNGNSDIYLAAGTAPSINSGNFFDVASGANGNDDDDKSVTGYDLVTGLGSPNVAGLVPALAGVTPPSPDFTVSVTPGSQIVPPSGQTTYSVTVTAVGGFSGNVDLSVSDLPSGATGAFTPSSVTGSGSSTLTISTAETSVGTYALSVTATATSGSLTHTATATLVVANPDFSISANPSSLTVRHGSSTSSTITVTPSDGFTGNVSLTATVSPVVSNGPTVSFNPQQIGGGSGTSQLTVRTTSRTPRQGYTITVTGTTSGSLTHDVPISLTVN
jgi:subtilase family serine protease